MNRVVHFEIHAADADKMQEFYQSVFGWDIKDLGAMMGNYRIINTGADAAGKQWPGINGGMTPRRGALPQLGQAVNAFVCTIEVANVDETLGKIATAGGTIALDKMDVPGVGTLAYILDPENNIFGILQPIAS